MLDLNNLLSSPFQKEIAGSALDSTLTLESWKAPKLSTLRATWSMQETFLYLLLLSASWYLHFYQNK